MFNPTPKKRVSYGDSFLGFFRQGLVPSLFQKQSASYFLCPVPPSERRGRVFKNYLNGFLGAFGQGIQPPLHSIKKSNNMDTKLYEMVLNMATYCQENSITLALFTAKDTDTNKAFNAVTMNGNPFDLIKMLARAMDERKEIEFVLNGATGANKYIKEQVTKN